MHKITLTLPTEGGTRSSYNCRFIDYFLLDLAAADSDSLHPLSRIVPASSELPQCACCIRHITGAAVADFPCIHFRMGCKIRTRICARLFRASFIRVGLCSVAFDSHGHTLRIYRCKDKALRKQATHTKKNTEIRNTPNISS